jgi:hypothetical protein
LAVNLFSFDREMVDRRRSVCVGLMWINMPLLPRWNSRRCAANGVAHDFRWGPLFILVLDLYPVPGREDSLG